MHDEVLSLSSNTFRRGKMLESGSLREFSIVESDDMDLLGGLESRRIQGTGAFSL
jgi:hypothetical protein